MTIYDRCSGQVSDNYRLARSPGLKSLADGTYAVIRLPKNAFVTRTWIIIDTAAVGGAPTLTVGWTGNGETAKAADFMDTDKTEPTVLGMKTSNNGKYFSTAQGAITVTVAAGGATTLPTFRVFVEYSVLH